MHVPSVSQTCERHSKVPAPHRLPVNRWVLSSTCDACRSRLPLNVLWHAVVPSNASRPSPCCRILPLHRADLWHWPVAFYKSSAAVRSIHALVSKAYASPAVAVRPCPASSSKLTTWPQAVLQRAAAMLDTRACKPDLMHCTKQSTARPSLHFPAAGPVAPRRLSPSRKLRSSSSWQLAAACSTATTSCQSSILVTMNAPLLCPLSAVPLGKPATRWLPRIVTVQCVSCCTSCKALPR